MSPSLAPTVGMRFSFFEIAYEVTHSSHGFVRYSCVTGGKVFKISVDAFNQHQNHEKFRIEYSSDRGEITSLEIDYVIRQRSYAEAAIRSLETPTSIKCLNDLIPLIAASIGDDSPPSAKTVIRWICRFRLGNRVLSGRSKGNRTLRFDPFIEILLNDAIQSVFLCKERRDAKDVEAYIVGRLIESGRMTTHSSSLKIPTIRTIQRRIGLLDPYVVAVARHGKHAADRIARSSGKSFKSAYPLSIVQIDSHRIDVLVVCEVTGEVIGRPYLVTIIDIATRMIVGFHYGLHPPSATTSLAVLKFMLSNYGRAAQIIPDNGSEFKNTTFARVCDELRMTIVRAEVYDPDDKAHKESFYRTLTHGISHKLPGTTFSSPAARGHYPSMKMAVLTITQTRELTKQWLEEIYHKSIHTGTGRAPLLDWADRTREIPPLVMSDAEINDIARKPHTRTVFNGSVTVDYLKYFSHSLAMFQGETVVVMVDELDLSNVIIRHPEKPEVLILADSTDLEYTKGLTIYEHQEATKIRKAMSKRDLDQLGKYSQAYSKFLLLEKIHSETKIAKNILKRIRAEQADKKSIVVRPPYTAGRSNEAKEALPPPEKFGVVNQDVPEYESIEVGEYDENFW